MPQIGNRISAGLAEAAEGTRALATLSIRIDDRLDAELRNVAARTGISMSAFVREAVRRQLEIAPNDPDALTAM